MIPLSKRYLPHVSLALLLTLFPVVLHSYVELNRDDCVPAQEILALCDKNIDVEVTGRRLKNLFGEVESCGGHLPGPSDSPSLDYWVLRSYDPKALYHLPETGFVRGAAPSRRTTEELSSHYGPVPVHRAYYNDSDGDIYVAYVLIYNSEPIANPYLAQILSFPKQLLTGTSPMNLLFVTGRGPRGTLAQMEEQGALWLLDSLGRYRSLCRN